MNEIIFNHYPKSFFAESIRTIKTNLRFSAVNNEITTIIITSSVSGEGKSFIAANLAASFATSNEKVLIIDCDLRKGRQQSIFNLNSEMGLSNLLIDKNWSKDISKYIQSTEIENLSILPAGIFPPDPVLLLESSKLETVMQKLQSQYDKIILDTPPVIGLTDTLILSKFADCTLIVAKAHKTTLELLENTKETLEKAHVKIAGVILNYTEQKTNKYYNNNYYQK